MRFFFLAKVCIPYDLLMEIFTLPGFKTYKRTKLNVGADYSRTAFQNIWQQQQQKNYLNKPKDSCLVTLSEKKS